MQYWRKTALAVLLAFSVTSGSVVPVYAEESTMAEEALTKTIGYVFVDETEAALPGTQNVVVGFTDTTVLPEYAVLRYHSVLTGESYEMAADAMVEGAILFSEEYGEDSAADEFVLDGICYTTEGQEQTVLFAEEGIETTGYTVGIAPGLQNEEASAAAEETNVYVLDENGEMAVESGNTEQVEEAISAAAKQAAEPETVQKAGRSAGSNGKKLVVYLCAGHDATHSGAAGYGLREEQLTFKVQQYCREALEKYGDVVVYTDRDSVECKYPGSSLSYCLNQRVADAAAAGADVFVDLHFNSTGFGGASGSEVYYPNISYNEWIHKEGNTLANQILNQLSALGLPNRGAKIKDCTTNDRDDAGNLADYYTSINASKAYGMTGIIVEHAFIDSESDAAKLMDENFLKELGISDAKGIASAYGLAEGEDTGKMLYWDVNPGDWYYEAAEYAFQNDIMTGLRKTQFGPGEKLARAQFATILHRMQGTPEVEYTEKFPDVPNGQFYTSAVLWASQKEVGIITGYDNTGHFGPADQITREQLVTMMYRYAGFVKADTSIKKELDEFPDADMVNAFASDAMKWAVGTGMIKGDNGYLNPGGNANRAECATIIMRFIRYLEEHPAQPQEDTQPETDSTPDTQPDSTQNQQTESEQRQ